MKQLQMDMEALKEAMNMMTSKKNSLNGNIWNMEGRLNT